MPLTQRPHLESLALGNGSDSGIMSTIWTIIIKFGARAASEPAYKSGQSSGIHISSRHPRDSLDSIACETEISLDDSLYFLYFFDCLYFQI